MRQRYALLSTRARNNELNTLYSDDYLRQSTSFVLIVILLFAFCSWSTHKNLKLAEGAMLDRRRPLAAAALQRKRAAFFLARSIHFYIKQRRFFSPIIATLVINQKLIRRISLIIYVHRQETTKKQRQQWKNPPRGYLLFSLTSSGHFQFWRSRAITCDRQN